MLASPIGVRDILAGELGWLTVRIGIVAVGFFAVMVAFGLVHSPLGLLTVPAAVLTGLAFALPIYAFTVTQYNDAGFAVIFRLIVTPLFLFSGTFFPVDQLPAIVRPLAYATPLFHGVSLARDASLGTLEPVGGLVHIAVLLAFIGTGLAAARVTLRRRMVS
jgi:lipooligosaccharide transport system permease protein